jgi:hypothetical protein
MTISTITICTNECDFISQCLLSIYPFVDELMVVDNASTDCSVVIIQQLMLSYPKIVLIKCNQRLTLSAARQLAYKSVNSGFIMKWDADFVAYSVLDESEIDIPGQYQCIRKLFDAIDCDAIWLYTINVCHDLLHVSKNVFKVNNLILARKDNLIFTCNDTYYDMIQLTVGSNVKYMNNPVKHPFYFVHLQKCKNDDYNLYSIFKNEYQLANINEPFDRWYEAYKKQNYCDAVVSVKKSVMSNLMVNTYKLPLMSIDLIVPCKDKYIIVRPDKYGGLCNRFKFISSAIWLASSLNMDLYIDWIESSVCNCKLNVLFDVDKQGKFIMTDGLYDNSICKKYIDNAIVVGKDHIIDINVVTSGTLISSGFNYIGSQTNYIPYNIQLMSCISSRIKECVNRFYSENNFVIGLHIRRTDNLASKDVSTNDKIIKYLQTVIDKISYSGLIFIACDDLNDIKYFKGLYPQIRSFNTKSFDRNSSDAIIDAVIELLILSKSEYLIGSYFSSYSEFASTLTLEGSKFIVVI